MNKKMFEEFKKVNKNMKISDNDLAEIEPMYKLSHQIVQTVIGNECIKDGDTGWAVNLLMAMARATSMLILGMEQAADDSKNVFKDYTEFILPMCNKIVRNEIEETGILEEIDVNVS